MRALEPRGYFRLFELEEEAERESDIRLIADYYSDFRPDAPVLVYVIPDASPRMEPEVHVIPGYGNGVSVRTGVQLVV